MLALGVPSFGAVLTFAAFLPCAIFKRAQAIMRTCMYSCSAEYRFERKTAAHESVEVFYCSQSTAE